MSGPVLFLKAQVKGHTRRRNGRLVFVSPYRTRVPPATPDPTGQRDQRQPDLFGDVTTHATLTEPEYEEPDERLAEPLEVRHHTPPAADAPDLSSYDHILVMFSGGKDSVAAVLSLLEQGAPRDRIELWHHDIDGHGETFMDWPITPAYCRAFARAIGVPIFFSYREGGFEREMNRDNAATARVVFEAPGGEVGTAGGKSDKMGTRKRFPQVSADLSTRWCSGALKVDVGAAAIRNQPRFTGKRTLVCTGERGEESPNRARYKTFEPDRTHTQSRHVDHWRPVHGWKEGEVWEAMRRNGVVAHPAYHLGYGRLSCRHCIFASEAQLATNRALYPESFQRVAGYEQAFNHTIHRSENVNQRADKGQPYAAALAHPELARLADSTEWDGPMLIRPEDWTMPAGAASKDKAGPI
jgi:3'-phosphoadenosine 5'-phosphosulfate sulfotransferase (PAPS reductase)/FAD synthetase